MHETVYHSFGNLKIEISSIFRQFIKFSDSTKVLPTGTSIWWKKLEKSVLVLEEEHVVKAVNYSSKLYRKWIEKVFKQTLVDVIVNTRYLQLINFGHCQWVTHLKSSSSIKLLHDWAIVTVIGNYYCYLCLSFITFLWNFIFCLCNKQQNQFYD